MNNFTYPILLEDDSSYKDDYYFRIERVEHSFDDSSMCLKLELKSNSEYLNKLVENKKAYVLVSATTVLNKIVKEIDALNDEIELSIPIESIIDHDNVVLEAYVLVKEQFSLEYCNEMDEQYSDFAGKTMKKNMRLAVSNSYILYYKRADDSFIRLYKADLNGKGIHVAIDETDSIMVKAGSDFCDAFDAITGSDNLSAKALLECLVSFLAIYQTALQIKDDNTVIESIKEYPWYEGLEYLFNQNDKKIEEFFDNETMGANDFFEEIQKITNNELEKTVIRCRDYLDSKGGEDDD